LDVWECCIPYWEAFWTLHRSRGFAVGMGGAMPLGLAYSELSRYATDHGLAIDDVVALVGRMDMVYLEHSAQEKK
jgi:hypothetical protein